MKQHDQKIKFILMMIVVISIVFSLVYVEKAAHHECSGQGCPICLELHVARDLLNAVKAGMICYMAIVLMPAIIVHTLYRYVILRRQRTLITLKVKLRN